MEKKSSKFLKLVLSMILINGCHEHKNLSNFPPEKPLIAGVDGWSSSNLKKFGESLEKKLNVPVEIAPVHYWQNNLEEIRQAHMQGRKIILTGYSAGCHQTAIFTAKECERENISIDLMILLDPTFTNNTVFYRPQNVEKIVFYLSSADFDIMGWARGKPENIKPETRRIEISRKPGTHLGYINEKNFESDFEKFIAEYTKHPVLYADSSNNKN